MTLVVIFRIPTTDVRQLLSRQGLYLEPRDEEGRKPPGLFRAIWLPKHNCRDIDVALRAAEQWSCLVRNNRKFGLRVLKEHASTARARQRHTVS